MKSAAAPQVDAQRLHYLFAVWMAGGNAVLFRGLQEKISRHEEFISSFQPIEMFPTDLIAKIPPISLVGALKNSAVAHKRFRLIEHQVRVPISAAYFFQHTYIMSLVNFRKRVPYLVAMDGVPIWYAKNKLWYTHEPFDPNSPVARLKRSVTRSVYAQAYHLLPFSRGVRECLIEDYGIPEQRVTVLPCPVDTDKWIYPGRSAAPKDEGERRFNILFVGADYERKGGDLLAAIARRPDFSDTEFHFVTKDFSAPPAGNIFIHSNLTPNSGELIQLYRNADALVVPTRQDTYLIAALEAMAMGLPVISTRVGGIPDIILEGETGYFVPVDDVETLVDRISRLRGSRELRLDMGIKGRRRAETVFSLDRHVDVVLDLMHRAATRLPHAPLTSLLPEVKA